MARTEREQQFNPHPGRPVFGLHPDRTGVNFAALFKQSRRNHGMESYGIGGDQFKMLPPEVTVPVSSGLPFEAALYVMGRTLAEASGALRPGTIFTRKKK